MYVPALLAALVAIVMENKQDALKNLALNSFSSIVSMFIYLAVFIELPLVS